MPVTTSKCRLLYLAIGNLAWPWFAAIGTANTQDPVFGVLMAWTGLVFFVALFELAAVIKATTKSAVIVAGALGLLVCFWVIGAVSDAVITGSFSLLPHGQFWWAIPVALMTWTGREIFDRKRRPRLSIR